LEKSWRIIDIINWGSEYFVNKNISDARLNIELILCNVLQYDRIKLYLDYEKPLTDGELSSIKDQVKRRSKREPIQYIIGETKFLSYTIKLNENVLIPRPETEILVDLIKKSHSNESITNILEIGAGSGCISIALGDYFKQAEVLSIDISNNALELATMNANNNGVNNINFSSLDILKYLPNQKFDLIVSNPPYISETEYLMCEPEVTYYEPKIALSDNSDGLTFYRRFNQIFDELLNDDGIFYLEIGYNQQNDLEKLFQHSYIIDIYKDFSDLPRYLVGKKIKKSEDFL